MKLFKAIQNDQLTKKQFIGLAAAILIIAAVAVQILENYFNS